MDDDATSALTPSVSGSVAGAGVARRPKKIERSCVLCHRRKIRCDKKSPCSTCTKTGVLCCYPSAEQPVRRPRKTTISDVAERLVQLERTLYAISSTDSQPDVGSPGDREGTAQPSKEDEVETESVTEEFLLQNGDTSRYMNDLLISRVLEEVSLPH